MNTQHRPAPPRLTASAPADLAHPLHQRASLEGLDVRPLRFELWLLAGGERRRTRRPKNAQT
jgi:hypothetical protein